MKHRNAISLSILLLAVLRPASAQVVGCWPFNEKLPGTVSDTVGNSIVEARGNGRHGTPAPGQQRRFLFCFTIA
jgi:hypothetical protein